MNPRHPDPWRNLKRPGRWRRVAREFALSLFLAALAAVLAAYALRRPLLERRLKELAAAALLDRAGIDARVAAIEGTYLNSVVLLDVALTGTPRRPELREARVERIEVRFDPLALALGDAAGLQEVRIEGARVSLDLAAKPPPAEPASAIAPAPAPPPAGATAAPGRPSRPFHEFPVPSLSVSRLDLDVQGRGVSLHARNAGLRTAGTVHGVVEGLAACDAWRIEASGRVLEGSAAFLRVAKVGPRVEVTVVEENGDRPARARVTLPDSLSAGSVSAALLGRFPPLGTVRLEGELALPPGGAFSVKGEIGEADAEALARLLGGLPVEPSGLLRLFIDVRGDAFDPARMRGDAKIRWTGGTWTGGPSLESLDAGVRLEPGLALDADGSAGWAGGRAKLTASGGPDAACLLRLRVQSADLGPLRADLAGMPADLTITAEGRATGGLTRPGFQGRVRIEGKDALGVPDAFVEATGAIDPEIFELSRARAVCPGGAVLVEGRGGFAPGGDLSGKAQWNLADLSLWVPPGWASRFPVHGSLQGSGNASRKGGEWSATGEFRAEGAGWGSVGADLVHVAFQAASGSLEGYDLVVARDEGRLEIPFLELASRDGEIRGRLPFVRLAVGDEALTSAGPAEFALAGDRFRLTGAKLLGDWARVSAEGELQSDGRVSGRVAAEGVRVDRALRLLGLRPDVSGTAALRLQVEGTKEDPRLEGGLLGSGIRIGDAPAVDVLAGLRFSSGRFQVFDAEASSEAGRATLRATVPFPWGPGKPDGARILEGLCESPDLDVELRFEDFRPARLPWKGRAPDGVLEGRASLRGPLTGPQFSAAVAGRGLAWNGLAVPRLSLDLRSEGGGIRLAKGECRAETEFGTAEIEGWVPLRTGVSRVAGGAWHFEPFSTDAPFDVRARTGTVDFRRILERLQPPERFRRIEGTGELRELRIDGTWADPTIEAEGRVEGIWTEGLARPGRASFELDYSGGQATLAEFEAEIAGGRIEAEGRIPVRLDVEALRGRAPILEDDAEVEGEWRVRGVEVDCAAKFVPGIEKCFGRLDARGTVSGPWRDVDVQAEARLGAGALNLQNPDLPKLGSLEARLEIRDRAATLEAEAESGGGRMSASGVATLGPGWKVGPFSVDLLGRDRPIVYTGPFARARADFRLNLAGTREDAELQGLVNVHYTEVERRIDLSAPASGAPGLVPGFTLPLLDRVRMDLTVVTPEGIRLVSEVHRSGISLAYLDVRFRGNLRVVGPTTAPAIVGRVSTEAGDASLPFYSLNLVSGDVNFLEANPHNPQLRIVTKTAKGDSTIFASVNGTLRAPEVVFYSEPPMPEEDIKTFLATGVRPDAWHGELAGGTLGVQIAALLVKQVSPYVFGKGGGGAEGFLERLSFGTEKSDLREALTYRAEFRLLDWLWLVGEKDEWEHYNLKLRGKFGWRTR